MSVRGKTVLSLNSPFLYFWDPLLNIYISCVWSLSILLCRAMRPLDLWSNRFLSALIEWMLYTYSSSSMFANLGVGYHVIVPHYLCFCALERAFPLSFNFLFMYLINILRSYCMFRCWRFKVDPVKDSSLGNFYFVWSGLLNQVSNWVNNIIRVLWRW